MGLPIISEQIGAGSSRYKFGSRFRSKPGSSVAAGSGVYGVAASWEQVLAGGPQLPEKVLVKSAGQGASSGAPCSAVPIRYDTPT